MHPSQNMILYNLISHVVKEKMYISNLWENYWIRLSSIYIRVMKIYCRYLTTCEFYACIWLNYETSTEIEGNSRICRTATKKKVHQQNKSSWKELIKKLTKLTISMIVGILNQEVNEVTSLLSLFSVDKLGRGMPLNFNSQVMVNKKSRFKFESICLTFF